MSMVKTCLHHKFLYNANKKTVQARLTMSGLPLKDGGAKIAQRVAALTAEIATVRSSLPTAAAGMRGSSVAAYSSMMVPVNSPSQVPPLPPPPHPFPLRPQLSPLPSA